MKGVRIETAEDGRTQRWARRLWFGVRLRNPERVKLPLSNVSWWAWGNRLAEVHRLPPSTNPWHA